jgi:hypothetical protein
MTAQEFLISKKMLTEDEATYPINTPAGKADLIELLNEYVNVFDHIQAKEQAKTGQKTKPGKK